MGESSGWAVGAGALKKGRGRRKLNMDRGLWRVRVCWRGDRLHGMLVDGRWHGSLHDGRVHHGPSVRRGDRVGPLAAVAPMRQLVVVEATCQLGLFQMSGDVLVWHLLETSLQKINFLNALSVGCSRKTKHISIPRPRSKPCLRQWMPVFCSSERRSRVG